MAINVVHVLGTARAEGRSIAAVPSLLARRLDPERYRIYACFLGEEGPLLDQMAAAGVEVCTAPWAPPFDLAGAARFWSALRARKFDLVHQHFGGRSVRWMARRTTGAPLIMHLHGRVMETEPNNMVRMVLADADAVIANSAATAACVEGIRPEVIYPGAPLFSPPADVTRREPVVIGSAARLVPLKGISFLIDAVARLATELPGLQLEIAGTGEEEDSLRKQAAQLGIGDRVRFLGWREDLGRVMSAWQLYCQPSIEEGLGITVLEAMATGLPVIASDVGGIPEVVQHGVTGYLVSVGSVEALSEHLRLLVQNRELRQELGSAGYRRVREQFSEELMVSRVVEVYDQVLNGTRT
jgi:glycosyltransferase involved in cell wall biosynthesis